MDLTTHYLGMTLKNPIVASSSPMTAELDGIRRLEDAGVSAVVLPSLFEVQVEGEVKLGDDPNAGRRAGVTYIPEYFPKMTEPDAFYKLIHSAKQSVQIPVIASLNAVTRKGWIRCAQMLEQAGADALEMNLYSFPTTPNETSAQVERKYLEAVRVVLGHVHIPVAVKITPFITALPHFANSLRLEGVRGLAMFSRFCHPDPDIDLLRVVPQLSFTRSEDSRLAIRWAGILYTLEGLDLAITGGIHTHSDILKAITAGANVTMICSEILEHGVNRIGEIQAQLEHWMNVHEHASLSALRGVLSQGNVPNPSLFARGSYVNVISSYHTDARDLASAYLRST